MACQLDFFYTDEKNEIEFLKSQMKNVKESSDKVRKSMFARHGELMRKYLDLHDRLQIIERNICRGEVNISLQS
jgi:hypothetical protein